MSAGNQERVSFIEVARRIIEEAGKPITADEVWQAAQQSGLASLLQINQPAVSGFDKVRF